MKLFLYYKFSDISCLNTQARLFNWKCTRFVELQTQLAEQGEHMLILVSMCPSFCDGKWLYLLLLHDETSCCFCHSLCPCRVYECNLNSSQQTCRLLCVVSPLHTDSENIYPPQWAQLIPDTHSYCLIIVVSFAVWNIHEIISICELFGRDLDISNWGHTPQHLQPTLIYRVCS